MFMFQLEDQYRLFDYGINVNDVIQLMIRETLDKKKSPKKSPKKSSSTITKDLKEEIPIPSCSSSGSSSSDTVHI